MRDEWIGAIVVGAWLTAICLVVFGSERSEEDSLAPPCPTCPWAAGAKEPGMMR